MVLAVLHVTWTCLGIDGVRGIAYPKPIKVLKYAQLGSLLLGEKRCSQKQIQVVAGGLVYMSMFRRPLLGSLNAVWRFIKEFKHYPPVIKLETVSYTHLTLPTKLEV